MDIYTHYPAEFFLQWEMLQTEVVQDITTHNLCSISSPKNIVPFDITWKNKVKLDRTQMTIKYGAQ
jgi:hypothetical protein